jgi:hypothetical protein
MLNYFSSIFLAVAALSANAYAANSGCSSQPEKLASFTGHYANANFMEATLKYRTWNRGYVGSRTTALTIQKDGKVSLIYAWHEGVTFGFADYERNAEVCFKADGANLMVVSSTEETLEVGTRFTLVSRTTEDDGAGAYLQLLLSGCYADQSHNRWCFSDGALRRNSETPRKAFLLQDTSELPGGGVTLAIDEDYEQLWHFVPRPKGSWSVYRTTGSTDEHYIPISELKPWLVLSPTK